MSRRVVPLLLAVACTSGGTVTLSSTSSSSSTSPTTPTTSSPTTTATTATTHPCLTWEVPLSTTSTAPTVAGCGASPDPGAFRDGVFYPTLEDALAAGGTAPIEACPGEHQDTALAIDSDTELIGLGGAQSVTLRGTGSAAVIHVQAGVAITLRGLTVTNGNAVNGGGLSALDAAGATIEDCVFEGNSSSFSDAATYGGWGGGVAVGGSGSISRTVIADNEATLDTAGSVQAGGLLVLGSGSLGEWVYELQDVLIERNHVDLNGGGGGLVVWSGGTVNGNGTTVLRENTVSGAGGGFAIHRDSRLTGIGVCLNVAGLNGGGGYAPGGELEDVVISENEAPRGGGLAGALSTEGSLVDVEISWNHALELGGGLTTGTGDGLFGVNVDIHDNTSDGDGGGVGMTESGLLAGVDIHDNFATGRGGGLSLIDTTDWLQLEDATIERNEAGGAGGGLYAEVHEGTLTRVSIRDNTSGTDGGGLYLDLIEREIYVSYGNYSIEPGVLDTAETTVVGNTATNAGGGMYVRENGPSTSTWLDAVFASNTATSGGGLYLEASTFDAVNADFGSATTDNAPTDVETSLGGPFAYGAGATFTCDAAGCVP